MTVTPKGVRSARVPRSGRRTYWSQLGLVLSTVVLLLLACLGAYFGIVICVALTIRGFELHEGPRAVLSAVVYAVAAYAAPAVIGAHFFRTRGWGLLRTLRVSAIASLAVNIALSPIGIAALSM